MKSLIYYLVQVIICSGILYSCYHFALRNKKFHLYNRYYLMVTVLLSIVVPLVHVPVYLSSADNQSGVLQTLSTLSPRNFSKEMSPVSNAVFETSLQNIFLTLYLIVAVLVFVRFITAIFKIRKIISKYVAERIDHFYFINTNEPGTPFSFFRWLFWNKKIDLDSEHGQQVFRHELFHIE